MAHPETSQTGNDSETTQTAADLETTQTVATQEQVTSKIPTTRPVAAKNP